MNHLTMIFIILAHHIDKHQGDAEDSIDHRHSFTKNCLGSEVTITFNNLQLLIKMIISDMILTNSCEDCKGEHQGATQSPHLLS